MSADHRQNRSKGGTVMLEPTRVQRQPIEVVRVVETPPAPTAALVLDSLGRMHPATAITLVLTVAAMIAGMVVAIVALVGMVVAAAVAIAGGVAIAATALAVLGMVLGGHAATPPAR